MWPNFLGPQTVYHANSHTKAERTCQSRAAARRILGAVVPAGCAGALPSAAAPAAGAIAGSAHALLWERLVLGRPPGISCPGAWLGPPHPSLGSRLPAASGAGPLPVGPRAWSWPAHLRDCRGRATSEGCDLEALGEGAGLGGGATGPSPLPAAAPGMRKSGPRRALRGADGLEEGASLRPRFGSVEVLGFDSGNLTGVPLLPLGSGGSFSCRRNFQIRSTGFFCLFVFVAGATSVQFSRSVVSDSLRPRGLQHARPPCPSPTPEAYSNLEDLSSPTRAWPGPGQWKPGDLTTGSQGIPRMQYY